MNDNDEDIERQIEKICQKLAGIRHVHADLVKNIKSVAAR
jgi:hypothetical protein